jgi:hypothetical protein
LLTPWRIVLQDLAIARRGTLITGNLGVNLVLVRMSRCNDHEKDAHLSNRAKGCSANVIAVGIRLVYPPRRATDWANEPLGCRIGPSDGGRVRLRSFISTRFWAIASVTFPQQVGTDANEASCTSISIGRFDREGLTADARTLRITVPRFRCGQPVGCASGRLQALPPRSALTRIPRACRDSSGGYHRQASFRGQASDRDEAQPVRSLREHHLLRCVERHGKRDGEALW